jgi:hypothetical protein
MASVTKSRTWGQNQQHNSIKNIQKKTVMVIAHMAFWPGKLKTKKEKE